jgi:5'-methylthioadenosine phosphorylase
MLYQDIPQVDYAIIGGSGTWACEFPDDLGMAEIKILSSDMEFETPYGRTVPFKWIRIDGSITADGKAREFLTVPFHGFHGLAPHNNPSEQVFWVFQQAGVKYILAEGSGGAVNHLLEPGDVIIPSDFIDFTKRRSHIAEFTPKILRMRDPICNDLSLILYNQAKLDFKRVFRRGIYGVPEAPRFESVAEINMFRDAHVDICAHTLVPEVYLARAIGACYAGLYIISNYAEGIITNWDGDQIFDIYKDCALTIGRIMVKSIANIGKEKKCACQSYCIEVPQRINQRIHQTDC